MRRVALLAAVLALGVTTLISGPASAAADPPLRLTVDGGGRLTLPAGDGYRDVAAVTFTGAENNGPFDLVLVRGGTSVTLESEWTVPAGGTWTTELDVAEIGVAGRAWIRVLRDGVTVNSVEFTVSSGDPGPILIAPKFTEVYPYVDHFYDDPEIWLDAEDEYGVPLPLTGVMWLERNGTRVAETTFEDRVFAWSGFFHDPADTVDFDLTALAPGRYTIRGEVAVLDGEPQQLDPVWIELIASGPLPRLSLPKGSTVFPERDGHLDALPLVTEDVSDRQADFGFDDGTLTVRRDGKLVERWNVKRGSRTAFAWDGRDGRRIRPGRYDVQLTMSGDGLTNTTTARIRVDGRRLVQKSTRLDFSAASAYDGKGCKKEGTQVRCEGVGAVFNRKLPNDSERAFKDRVRAQVTMRSEQFDYRFGRPETSSSARLRSPKAELEITNGKGKPVKYRGGTPATTAWTKLGERTSRVEWVARVPFGAGLQATDFTLRLRWDVLK